MTKKQAMKTTRVEKAPRQAVTLSDLCRLTRDNVHTRDFWLMVDGPYVVIAAQKSGSMPTGKVVITRKAFDAFIDWYQDGVWPRPRAKQ